MGSAGEAKPSADTASVLGRLLDCLVPFEAVSPLSPACKRARLSSEACTPSTEPAQVVSRPPNVTSSTVSEMIEGSLASADEDALLAANSIFVWLLVEGFRLAHGHQKIRPLLLTLGLLR